MIGSHNTFSYLPAKHWWVTILKPWYKCQSKDIIEQIDSGIRFFDIRVRFNKHKNYALEIVHNNIVFSISEREFYNIMDTIYKKATNLGIKLYFRFILDIRKKPKNDVEADLQEAFFESFLTSFKKKYNPILIVDHSIVFWTWKIIYHYIGIRYTVIEDHASVMTKWYEYLLGTKHYADKVRYKYVDKKDDDNVYLLDYI